MEDDRERSYWCFVCEREFKVNCQAQACIYCANTAFEAISTSNNSVPSSFQVFEIPRQNTQQRNNSPPPSTINGIPRNFVQAIQFAPGFNMINMNIPQANNNLLHTLNHIQNSLFAPGGGIVNLINSLFGQSNLTPASPNQIRALEVIQQVPECSICQEQNDMIQNEAERRGVKLKCGHMFHHHCIGPWFQKTNTCPYCRVRI